MAKLTKSQKARSQKVRLDKVERTDASKQKQLTVATGAVHALGIGIGIANPIAGALVAASGLGVIAKDSIASKQKAASESKRIKRGTQPSTVMDQAAAAYSAGGSKGPQGPRLSADQMQKFKAASKDYAARSAPSPVSHPTDGMTDQHVRINKNTGKTNAVSAYKTPTRAGWR